MGYAGAAMTMSYGQQARRVMPPGDAWTRPRTVGMDILDQPADSVGRCFVVPPGRFLGSQALFRKTTASERKGWAVHSGFSGGGAGQSKLANVKKS